MRIIVIGILSIIRVAIRVGIIVLLLSLLSIIVLVGAIRIARLVGILTLILLNHSFMKSSSKQFYLSVMEIGNNWYGWRE